MNPSSNPTRLDERNHKVFFESIERHRNSLCPSPEEYLLKKLLELPTYIANRKAIYLDTNHWINLRHVRLGRPDQPYYREILEILLTLVKQKQVFCPLGFPLFEELMRQTDEKTRRPMAQLMDELSAGFALKNLAELGEDEWRFHCYHIYFGDGSNCPAVIPWTKPGFWNAWLSSPWNIKDIPKPITDMAWIDTKWTWSIEDAMDFMGSTSIADHLFQQFVKSSNAAIAVRQTKRLTYNNVLAIKKFEMFQQFCNREIGFKAWKATGSPNDCLKPQLAFVENQDLRKVPSLSVASGIQAASIYTGRTFEENDMIDVMHLGSAVPYCSAVCCDKEMANLLRQKPLEVRKYFDIEILNKPEDILNYLRTFKM